MDNQTRTDPRVTPTFNDDASSKSDMSCSPKDTWPKIEAKAQDSDQGSSEISSPRAEHVAAPMDESTGGQSNREPAMDLTGGKPSKLFSRKMGSPTAMEFVPMNLTGGKPAAMSTGQSSNTESNSKTGGEPSTSLYSRTQSRFFPRKVGSPTASEFVPMNLAGGEPTAKSTGTNSAISEPDSESGSEATAKSPGSEIYTIPTRRTSIPTPPESQPPSKELSIDHPRLDHTSPISHRAPATGSTSGKLFTLPWNRVDPRTASESGPLSLTGGQTIAKSTGSNANKNESNSGSGSESGSESDNEPTAKPTSSRQYSTLPEPPPTLPNRPSKEYWKERPRLDYPAPIKEYGDRWEWSAEDSDYFRIDADGKRKLYSDFQRDSLLHVPKSLVPAQSLKKPERSQSWSIGFFRPTPPPSYQSELGPEWQVVSKPTRFFSTGRIFKTVWFEAGDSDMPGRPDLQWTKAAPPFHGVEPYAKYRWFVVVKKRKNHCLCFSIGAYSSTRAIRGLGRDMVVLHSATVPPPRPYDDEGITRDPIAMILEDGSINISPLARLDCSRIYTVEHNIKAFKVGRIHPASMEKLAEYWKESVE